MPSDPCWLCTTPLGILTAQQRATPGFQARRLTPRDECTPAVGQLSLWTERPMIL